MSSFDKCVAQLVRRMGDDVPKEVRVKILQNISHSIDDYQHLRDLADAQALMDAKAAKKALEEERCRKLRHQANVPLFSSSMSKTTTSPCVMECASGKHMRLKGMSASRLSRMNASVSTSSKRERPRTVAAASARTTVHPKTYAVQGRSVDFGFSKEISVQLHKLGNRALGKRPSVHRSKPIGTASASASAKPSVGAVSASAPTEVNEPAARQTNSISIERPKRLSPPPLDQTAMKESESVNSTTNGIHEVPRISRSETISYQETFKGFRFGRQDTESGKSTTFEMHSQGGEAEQEEAEEAEEEFIDDREDERRRTIQMQRPSRGAISDSSLDVDEARIANFPTTPKSQEKVKTISRVLVRHFLFSTLDDSDIAKFASIMDIEEFVAGTKILEKGNANDTFFIVLDGEAEMTIENDGEVVAAPLVRGSTFGDLGLMYEVSNTADVVARVSMQCASLERRTYKMITSRAMEDKRHRYIDFLSSLPVFAGLTSHQLEAVAECLKEDSYVEGQRLIVAGVPNHWMHIVIEGTLRVMAPDAESGDMKEVALLRRGDFAGHIEFLYHHVCVADVVVANAVVKTAKLSRRSFERIPSEARERMIRSVEEDETYAPYHQRMRSATPPPFDTTPPFDAPPSHLLHTMYSHKSA
ncbi:Cyclic nucleotidebinding domain containing protein [Leishmania braziliensis]|nr:Cyclic nucleotidebinding domain containing protein [Leishmania braziliensis]